MNLPPWPVRELIKTTCAWCAHFPCECTREAPCVCGGTIVGDKTDQVRAIQRHQETARHSAWRRRNGL